MKLPISFLLAKQNLQVSYYIESKNKTLINLLYKQKQNEFDDQNSMERGHILLTK